MSVVVNTSSQQTQKKLYFVVLPSSAATPFSIVTSKCTTDSRDGSHRFVADAAGLKILLRLSLEDAMKKLLTTTASSLLGLALFSTGFAQTYDRKALTLEGAKKVITAAVAEAKSKNAPGGAIAVVDEGGNLVAVERLDNTFAAGALISIGKARTAALFKRPTKAFEDIINKGRTAMATLNDFTPLQGGVPIVIDGQIVGAVGVSGAASAQQDEEIAIAGANALAAKSAQAR
jgi:glc operon protein GlcG